MTVFYKTQYDTVNNVCSIDYKNGFKNMPSNTWSIDKLNYVDYTKNIHDFQNIRINIQNDDADLPKDTLVFNELNNVATIEAIAQIKVQDIYIQHQLKITLIQTNQYLLQLFSW